MKGGSSLQWNNQTMPFLEVRSTREINIIDYTRCIFSESKKGEFFFMYEKEKVTRGACLAFEIPFLPSKKEREEDFT